MFTYKTKVRINPDIIKSELIGLRKDYEELDPTGLLRKPGDKSPRASAARSAFSRWNNLNHFYMRLLQMEDPKDNIPVIKKFEDGSLLIEVVASAKGNSARIYFKPSITSLTKEVRKAIIPVNDDNVFIYTDLKAAEFALRAVQAQDSDAIAEYHKGGDIYMHFAHLFPDGADRKTIKTILIANMYGKSAYSTSKDLGISETQAQRLLDKIARETPKFTMLKRSIIAYDQRNGGYYSPKGFDQTDLIKIAEIDPVKGFDPNLAWSAWTQSALGFIMQDFSTKFLNCQKGVEQTFLSVFDSVVVEIKKDSIERFKDFFKVQWSPLLPGEFKTGSSMYEAMY